MDQPTCPHCGGVVPPAAGKRVRIYCSGVCKQRAKDARKMERYRNDPEFRAVVLARQTKRARAMGVRPMIRRDEQCGSANCEGKHFAKGFCRRHYYADRRNQGLDHGCELILLNAVARLHGVGDAKVKPVKCRVGIGVLVTCPACGATMCAKTPHERTCPACRTTALLNPEEVAWVISARRSTAA